jgi:GH15 family glucan-1,4-alpha-glucosidase
VGSDGGIDWLCLQRFDGASVFAAILDARRGGRWQLVPTAPYEVHPRYRDLTNVLDLRYTTRSGVVLVTDFMPVEEEAARDKTHDEPRLVRIVECLSGRVRMRHTFDPRPDYAQERPEFRAMGRHLHASGESLELCVYCSEDLPGPRYTFALEAGEAVAFALRAGHLRRCAPQRWSVQSARDALRRTEVYWWRWIAGCRYDGPYKSHVWRSALALKLMTYMPTGAIVAAPTTSLPEAIGGQRNWDYRYTWLRDASFTLFAFFQLGLHDEAHRFFDWLSKRHIGRALRDVPNLFDLSGRAGLEEHELRHLEGYRKSRPVRVGNAAVNQLQLDVYGEVLDSAYLYARFGGEITEALWSELHDIVELTLRRWDEPDQSIWEVRSERRQFTYSKLMCWVAVDRGLRLADRFSLPHDRGRWAAARRRIHRRVLSEGYSKGLGAFTQVLGGDALDAAVLRISQIRFLPDRDPRVHSTIAAIEEHLARGVLTRRYNSSESDDGVTGDEGAFLMCSFWLVDALAHAGELERAEQRFERLLSFASPLGLFSEEVDMRDGELLGNFPQAFTHLALVGAAVNIERARHRHIGVQGLR